MVNKGLFVDVGRCIYCPRTDLGLTDEHIIPFGLLPKGEPGWVLRKASCERCREITSAFERAVLRRLWHSARAALRLRSYRRKDPIEFPLTIERNSQPEEVILPIAEYPVMMMFMTFPLPAYLDKRTYQSGTQVNGNVTIQVSGPPIENIAKKLGANKISSTSQFEGSTFQRLLLKIAYGYTVATMGLDHIEKGYVLPAILGDSDDIGRWLGCDGQERLNPRSFHAASTSIMGNEILCRVRLFSNLAPEYIVVVGKSADVLYDLPHT